MWPETDSEGPLSPISKQIADLCGELESCGGLRKALQMAREWVRARHGAHPAGSARGQRLLLVLDSSIASLLDINRLK